MDDKEFQKNYPILFKKYLVKDKIGKGAFGLVFLGTNIKTNKDVAIKIESKEAIPQTLKSEVFKLIDLGGQLGFPKFKSYGKTSKYNILIESLLGKSLENIFNENGKQFSLDELCMIAIQILERIESLHFKNFIHRDIKPDNFLIGKKDPNIIYLIDFGLAKKFRSKKTGRHINFKKTGRLTGTIRYSSPNALSGGEQSRKDDLISIGYMLVYFFNSKLPWQLIRDRNELNKIRRIYKMKKETKPEILCRGLPNEMTEYMKYVENLRFEQKPNYEYLRNLFNAILKRNNTNIEKCLFSWIKSSDIKNLKNPVNLRKRKSSPMNRLYKKIKESLERNRSSSNESLGKFSYEEQSKILNDPNINLKIIRNNSKDCFDTDNLPNKNYKSKNNNETTLANLSKILDNKLLADFAKIDKPLENKNYTLDNQKTNILSSKYKPNDKIENNNILESKEKKKLLDYNQSERKEYIEEKKNSEKQNKYNFNNNLIITKKEKGYNKYKENNIINQKNKEKEIINENHEKVMKIGKKIDNNLNKNNLINKNIKNIVNRENNNKNKNLVLKNNNNELLYTDNINGKISNSYKINKTHKKNFHFSTETCNEVLQEHSKNYMDIMEEFKEVNNDICNNDDEDNIYYNKNEPNLKYRGNIIHNIKIKKIQKRNNPNKNELISNINFTKDKIFYNNNNRINNITSKNLENRQQYHNYYRGNQNIRTKNIYNDIKPVQYYNNYNNLNDFY